MTVQDLFRQYSHSYVAQRLTLVDSDVCGNDALRWANEIDKADPIDNEWSLIRTEGGYSIEGVAGSNDVIKTMTAAEVAGLRVDRLFPQKLVDAISILEEYGFFK